MLYYMKSLQNSQVHIKLREEKLVRTEEEDKTSLTTLTGREGQRQEGEMAFKKHRLYTCSIIDPMIILELGLEV